MNSLSLFGLFVASIGGGALNAVAGGGTFLTFPSLLFAQVPAVTANATSTVALWPGFLGSLGSYRHELAAHKKTLLPLGAVSVSGGAAGALLLLHTSSATFLKLVPFLLLLATLLFTFGGRITAWVRAQRGDGVEANAQRRFGRLLAIQLAVSIYGGYFGGGMGIVMLAAFAAAGMRDIHVMNALKAVLGGLINGVAVVTFIAAGKVHWPFAMVMMVGALAGGYGGAVLSKRVPQPRVRTFVSVTGAVLTIYFFIR